MISTLAKNGTGYTYSAVRTFDAWGNIRLGAQTSDPKGRYCASLGHKQDDESGLVYMRARYYEPTSGRFVSEDPGRQVGNWYSYCGSDPVNRVDNSGRVYWSWQDAVLGLGLLVVSGVAAVVGSTVVAVVAIVAAAIWVLVSAAVTIKEKVDEGWIKTYIEKPWERGMGTSDKTIRGLFGAIDSIKADGSIFQKIAACQLEAILWINCGEE